MGIDVWEHAYYLQYKNVRPDYVNAIYNIVDWNNVAERYAKAQWKETIFKRCVNTNNFLLWRFSFKSINLTYFLNLEHDLKKSSIEM